MSTVPPGACNCCTDCSGEFSFTGADDPFPFTMHRLAWCLTDLSSLWEMPNQRGQNIIIPGLEGRRARLRRADETDYALPFVVSGIVDLDGAPTDDEEEGLRDNLLYLRSTVLDPTGDETRPAQLVSPDGLTTLTADVQIMPLVRRAKYAGLWLGTLHIVIPAGSFS